MLPGVEKLKVRSSANAEDVPNFDGAGLTTASPQTLNKMISLTAPARSLTAAETS